MNELYESADKNSSNKTPNFTQAGLSTKSP
jgi:hypothetical protein